MSNQKKPSVLITHEEARLVRELLDNPNVAFAARNAKVAGTLYAKLPEITPAPAPAPAAPAAGKS